MSLFLEERGGNASLLLSSSHTTFIQIDSSVFEVCYSADVEMGEGNFFSNVIAAQFVCETNNQAHNNTHTHIEHVQSIGFKKSLTTNVVLYQIFAPCF